MSKFYPSCNIQISRIRGNSIARCSIKEICASRIPSFSKCYPCRNESALSEKLDTRSDSRIIRAREEEVLRTAMLSLRNYPRIRFQPSIVSSVNGAGSTTSRCAANNSRVINRNTSEELAHRIIHFFFFFSLSKFLPLDRIARAIIDTN